MKRFIRKLIRHASGVLLPFTPGYWSYLRICRLIPELRRYKAAQYYFLQEKAKEKGFRTLGAYYRFLAHNPGEIADLKQNLTYNGTHFFRGKDWPFFIEECLSSFRGREKVRVWCAGCSSGQEVYSVLLGLAGFVPLERVDVLATDYNDEMIAKCADGSYYNTHLSEIPEKYRGYLVQGPKKFRFKEEIRSRITVRNHNLLSEEYPGGFDVILCRNVLKFFAPEVVPALQERLSRSLAPGGFLFLSNDGNAAGEELIPHPERLGLTALDGHCIYRK